MVSLRRMTILGMLLVALILGACQTLPLPVIEQSLPSTSVPRPDAPAYAVRGPFGVGYRSLVGETDSERPLEISLWYPALIPAGQRQAITYPAVFKDPSWTPKTPSVVHGQALQDAVFEDSGAPYPLVVLSHGYLFNAPMYNVLAEHYASHGFVVMAPEHVEAFDPSFAEMWMTLIDRPGDVTRTLDQAERLTATGGSMANGIDMGRVAVVGHSYGGYTALAAAGAQYDVQAFEERCAAITADDPLSFFCAPLVPMVAEMATRAGLDGVPDGLWPSFGDSRVTAIVPLAGDSYLFGEAGLAQVSVPMMVMGGSADSGTPPAWGADPTYAHASSAQKSLVTFVGAEHMIFNTPCAQQPWMREHPASAYFCFDPVWDRTRALDLARHFSTAFLLDTLGGDETAHAVLLPEAVAFPGIEYATTLE